MTQRLNDVSGYRYANAVQGCAHEYLVPVIRAELEKAEWPPGDRRVIDVGCGNGSVAAYLHAMGYKVVGVDASTEGIELAARNHPDISFVHASVYDDLRSKFGPFPVAICLEVIEHLYSPRLLAKTLLDLLEPGGKLILSTPYHGYVKNLALAVSGRWDAHFTARWDHGHIKFWSINTLTSLFLESGFERLAIRRVGRIGPFAKSMILTAFRPG